LATLNDIYKIDVCTIEISGIYHLQIPAIGKLNN
jgi:hypothetical protein